MRNPNGMYQIFSYRKNIRKQILNFEFFLLPPLLCFELIWVKLVQMKKNYIPMKLISFSILKENAKKQMPIIELLTVIA